MSVETTDRKVTHEMDELLTEYAFTFRALVTAPSDIKGIIRNTVTGVSEDMEYVEDLPDEPTEDDRLKYTVAVNDDGIGGTVTLAWASDDTNELTIYRETTDIQSSAYEDYNQFPASTVESDFDRRTMVTQEINETIDRAIRLPITTDADTEMPEPVADAFIGWNSDGDALENKELPDPSTLVKATQEDAEAGTNNDKFMTPLRTAEAIDALVVPVTVVDSLVSTSATSALSANQGKILKDSIDALDLSEIVQIVNYQTGAMTTGTTALPIDDTIPQKTEGDQFMSLSITPTSASNKLKIDVVFQGGNAGVAFGVALFQDDINNALAAIQNNAGGAENAEVVMFSHFMTAGTTSLTTFKVRAGGSSTQTFNGENGARIFGGVMASSITITEIKA